jgi:hypothetical protein
VANLSVSITWSYTSDPLANAALGGFNVYGVDPVSGKALGTPIVVPKTSPYAATVPMAGYGKQVVRVTPFDQQGTEGIQTDKAVYIPLPPVGSISQVLV